MAYRLLLFAYYFCKDKETKLICDNLFEHCKINITISGLPRRPLIDEVKQNKKYTAICAGHRYTPTNTNNVNKTSLTNKAKTN
jgi:hypothetical protein